ncbi:hypothetical protein EIMP300_68910 [Escherichia coli]|uniref:Aldose 1-epimerase n=1 Tax=Escherichia coli TaxID=562 RepID=A0A8S0FYZ8_ECOLX|nr:hypothetical protein EIMP300_68910 [Escherichia coli]
MLFALSSDDGDQGFPGNLGATVQYRLTDDNRISITYRATVDKPCPVNMTNHVYFNLDGEQSDVRNHKLQILAEEYLPVDEGGIPHDGLKSVAGTSFDFRNAKIIASEFLADDDQRKVKGYDHAFLLQAKGDGKKVAAHVWSADEKLQLKVYTTAPAHRRGRFCNSTPATSSAAHRRGEPNLTLTGKGWLWKANFCRTARTTLNGRNRTASCVLAKSIPA